MPKKILILGGGVGGVVAAKRIAERIRGRVDAEITIVSDTDYYLLPPLLVNIALGDIEPSKAQLPLSMLERRGVKFVKAKVTKIDPDNRVVETDQGKFNYDYLLASLGVDFDFQSYNLGVGYHNYTLDGALKLRDALRSFSGGKVIIFTPEPIYRCGVYPFEFAAQLDTVFRKRGIRDRVDITLIHPFEKPIQPLGPEAVKITEEVYAKKGIKYIGSIKPDKVDDKEKTVILANGEKYKYDLLIVVPPARLPKPFEGTPLITDTPTGKWTAIDVYTGRSLKYDDVYLPGEHSMPYIGLPTAGVPVHFTALASATVIAGELLGEPIEPAQINAMTCAMDYGDLGMMFNCDVKLDLTGNKAAWVGSCYSILTSPLGRLIKDLFYKTWLATTM
ncbi:NAD(P)/FAD-dependent oxidoreductase [Vulcanisaeta distributa]|uniref:FAD-dependent pyridine nucleotide-disulfide oxidoreductase n=1 Tax=Vulcanisaeta distributa (strain DSM 14429 / JCM 11212 / NBRC 100878 / IC-017) TaxID=572478 RepID=E1QUM8_VULDI|nr:FAD/NAD(P)-binding oxidoreductase [Vulcanisaeta distributa]ADN51147.1 FAD-dependent pyridine nucleotide-disulfide oxidoreductase [Vulcanisaeta distributa DSM 14429]